MEDCQLIRCDCPPDGDNYCTEIDECNPSCILSQLRTNSCCDFIPKPFHAEGILHFLHIEKYTDVITENLNNIFVKVMVWSRGGTATGKNFKLIRTNLINADNSSDPAIPTTLSISDAVPPSSVTDVNSTLDSIDVIPVPGSNLDNGLQELSMANQACLKNLNCGEGLTTKCECHQCKIYSADFPDPVDKNYTSTPEGWYTLKISNDYATNITTSSDLSALHNPLSVNKWDEGTFGGWAPSMSDNDMWISFHGLKANICGIAVQGMAGSTYRSLDKFNVSSGGEVVSHINGDPIIYQSGVVLHSISTHYFPEPISEDCLQINVIEPSDPLRVGFRPGLIACEEETPYCQNEQVCTLVKTVVNEFEMAFNGELPELTPTNDSTKLKQEISQDPAGTAVFVSRVVTSVLEQNTQDLPANFSAKVTIENVDLSIEGREPSLLQNEGFQLNVDPLKSDDGGGTGGGGGGGGGVGGGDSSQDEKANKISISVPPEAFGDIDLNEPVVFVVAVTKPNKTLPPPEVEVVPEEDGETAKPTYELASPVVMINTFVGKHPTKLNSFTYSMHYLNVSPNAEAKCAFFHEQDIKQWNETIQWDFQGCEIDDNKTALKANCRCNHTTSYAVLLSLGESKLEGKWEDASSVITYIGCGISIVALIAALTIYFVLRSSISAARYAIHSNLMVALLLSTSVFVSGLIHSSNDAICVITKYLLQYLFTATFCWMLSEGLHLYRQIIFVFETENKKTWIYFAIGWAVPIILVLIGLVGSQMMDAHLPEKIYSEDRESFSRICFYSYVNKTVLFVFAPILLIVVVNVCILIRVTLVVIKAVKIQAEKDSSEKITQVKAGVRSALLLMPLLGCTHILAFVITVDGSFEIAYNVLNSLQGFFIALFYCGMNTEVRNAISQYIRRSKDANTIQGSTTGLRVNSETSKSKGLFGKKNKVQPTTQFTFTEGSSRVSDDMAPCQD